MTIKEFREKHNLSPEALASRLGVSYGTVFRRQAEEARGEPLPPLWVLALEALDARLGSEKT